MNVLAKFLENNWKFHFVSRVAGKIFLKIDFFIDTTYLVNISTSHQRCINIMDHRSNNVDSTLKMKQNPKSDFHRWITLKQSRCLTLKMLNQRCTTSIQPFFSVAQCRFNAVLTLILHYFNVVLAWPQRQLKLYQNKSG